MAADAAHDASVSFDDINASDPEAESSKNDLVVEISSDGQMDGGLRIVGEILTRVELDLARVSEKLINLNVLMMHVANKESDFEVFASEQGHAAGDSAERALQFDMLSGILDSEVTGVDQFMTYLQSDISSIGQMLSSYDKVGETFVEMEEKLRDSEKSLKQSHEQVSEIREQAAKFQRILSCVDGKEGWKGASPVEDDQITKAMINMQNVDQQRHILRMLEKSLAREIDLEKKLTESKQVEEELKHRLLSLEQEVFFTEKEAMDVCERWFEAENTSEVFMGISKDLLNQLQAIQFNLNGSMQREGKLRSKLDEFMEQLEAKENALQKFDSSSAKLNEFLVSQADNLKASLTEAENKLIVANSEAFTLREKLSSLENQLKESEVQLLNANVSVDENHERLPVVQSQLTEMENMIDDLKARLSKAESRAENAETECKLLTETNMELIKELSHLKCTSEKVDLLEKQLRESDIKLQHAVASTEASQEKQNMLNSTIKDMESLIENLKLKVSKAESRADSAEEKCIMLSESNAELNGELSFLRGRLECVEASLNQAEESKMATARDIGFRTKIITDLVMQLAIERERLHKQISSLALENKTLVVRLQQPKKATSVYADYHSRGNEKGPIFPESEVTHVSTTGSEFERRRKDAPAAKSREAAADTVSDMDNIRRVDAGILNFKHVFTAVLVALFSVALYMFLSQDRPF